MKAQYYAINTRNKTATFLDGFSCWEAVQNAFRFGFIMPDGTFANAIGRNPGKLMEAVRTGKWRVI